MRSSTLEWSPSEQFVVKADYQLYDLDGNPTIKGTVEESWTEQDGRRIRIQSPSLVLGDGSPANGYAEYTRESYLVHQALSAFVRPFPSLISHKDFAIDESVQKIASANVDCFSLIQPSKARTSNNPVYCTDADNHIVAMTGPLFTLERSDFRKYRDHEIPMDERLSYEGRTALMVHVTELDALPVASPSETTAKTALTTTHVPSEIMATMILSKKEPAYPKDARKKHITGDVLITAIITKQGTIGALDTIASPSALLSQAAKEAVGTWTYRPYLLNGVPTEMETTITVNFAMGK